MAKTEKTVLFLGADAEYAFNFRRGLMTGMRARGYRVVAAATLIDGFDPARFEEIDVEFVPWNVRKAGLDPIADMAALFSVGGILRRVRPEILFVHTVKPVIYGGLMGWMHGVPRRVAMVPGLGHTFLPPQTMKQRLASLVARNGYRFVLSRKDVTIFHNDDDIADLREIGVLQPSARVARVHGSGVDMAHFAPAPLPPGPPRFLFVGRLLREKGVYEFVEAARAVKAQRPEVRFVAVGAADANPSAVTPTELERWRAEGDVEFVGRMKDPRPAFANCHVFVLPSYREGTPRTNLEAMAMGRAIITTDVPGCRETVVHGVNGLLIPAHNAVALANAMLELVDAPERVRDMGQRGLELCAQRYELQRVTEATLALIEGKAAPGDDPNQTTD